jgi:type II secretory pathway component PulC
MKKVSFNFSKVKELFSSWQHNLLSKIKKMKRGDIKSSKPSFDPQVILNFLSSLTSPEKRAVIHKAFVISLFTTMTYYGAKGVNSIVQDQLSTVQKKKKIAYRPPAKPDKLNSKDIALIKQKNLFHTKLKDKEFRNLVNKPKVNLDKECKKAERKSNLGIKLLTTTVLQDSVKSIASVQVRGKPLNVREGDKIKSMAKVSRIDRLYMIVKNLKTGDCEYVERKGSQSHKKLNILNPTLGKKVMDKVMEQGIKNVGNHFTIKKAVKEKMLNNISQVLTQAKAIPIRSADGNMNFKITEIEAGSIYSQLNIQNGDVITRINGKPIQGINEVMNMFGSFREMSNLSLSIKRNGEEENLDYQFE